MHIIPMSVRKRIVIVRQTPKWNKCLVVKQWWVIVKLAWRSSTFLKDNFDISSSQCSSSPIPQRGPNKPVVCTPAVRDHQVREVCEFGNLNDPIVYCAIPSGRWSASARRAHQRGVLRREECMPSHLEISSKVLEIGNLHALPDPLAVFNCIRRQILAKAITYFSGTPRRQDAICVIIKFIPRSPLFLLDYAFLWKGSSALNFPVV